MFVNRKHRKQHRDCTDHSETPENNNDALKNFKLLSDPFIRPGAQKIYRLDGLLPCNSGASVVVSDPRPSPNYVTQTVVDLPLPRFKIDNYWVGPVPAKEVSFFNLNDNVNDEFLHNVCSKYGETEEVQVFYHPITKKHLGLGKAIFKVSRGAKDCVFALNNTTIMGSVIRVVFDSLGCQRVKVYENLVKNAMSNSAMSSLSLNEHVSQTQTSAAVVESIPHSSVLSVPPPYIPNPSNITTIGNSKAPAPAPIPPNMFSVPPPLVFTSQFHRCVPFTPSVPPPPTPRMLAMSMPPMVPPVPIPPYNIPPSPSMTSVDFQNVPSLSVTRPPPFISPSVRYCSDMRFNRVSAFSPSTPCSFPPPPPPPPPIPQNFISASSGTLTFSNVSPAQLNTSENEDEKASQTNSWKTRIEVENSQASVDGNRKESLDSRIAALLGSSDDAVTANQQPLPDLINSVSDSISKSTGISHWVPFTPSIPPPPLPPRIMSIPFSLQGLKKPKVDSHCFRDYRTRQLHNWRHMKYNEQLRKRMLKERHSVFTDKVFSLIISELKAIMRRDLSRRMVENLAFKYLDDWWHVQDKKNKILKLESKFGNANNFTVDEKPAKSYLHSLDASYVAISALLSRNARSGLESADISGFSFRAQLPKFPSFKKRPPILKQSPVDNSAQSSLIERNSVSDDSTVVHKQDVDAVIRDETCHLKEKPSAIKEVCDGDVSNSNHESRLVVQTSEQSKKRKATSEECECDFLAAVDVSFHINMTTILSHVESLESLISLIDSNDVRNSVPNSNCTSFMTDLKEEFIVQTVYDTVTSLLMSRIEEKADLLDDLSEYMNGDVTEQCSVDDIVKLECTANYNIYDEHSYSSTPSTYHKRNASKPAITTRLLSGVAKRDVPRFERRLNNVEMKNLYCFLIDGIDEEDINYLKLSYQRLLDGSLQSDWLNDTHWVPHPSTKLSTKKNCPHPISGCARAEGYYKIAPEMKTYHYGPVHIKLKASDNSEFTRSIQVSRDARLFQRRLIANLGAVDFAEIFKFSQLKLRKKNIQFARSRIHEWGLYACEHIGAEEMVIEYVGETIRQTVADVRERRHFAEGIGGSYMFRIDSDVIIDATKCGNLARFINHSCDPNCYAKIITMDSCKKVVIYSKRDITPGEEITYDYKFPIEDKKIPCTCGASNCRKSLN